MYVENLLRSKIVRPGWRHLRQVDIKGWQKCDHCP